MTSLELIEVGVTGLAAGFLGGLAGVGGSLLILPALGLILGYPDPRGTQHLYAAAAMTTNLVVAIPSAVTHWRSGKVRTDLLRWLLPTTAISLVIGVLLSNALAGWHLVLALAGFQVAYCLWAVWIIFHKLPDFRPEDERPTKPKLLTSAGATGLTAGILGLGGGVIQVPLLQVLCKTPLRQAIATSSAVICLTAGIGAAIKLATLGQHQQSVSEALTLALVMTPGAVVGALVGAKATHALPLTFVRVLIVILLSASAVSLTFRGGKMAGWW